MNTIAKTPKAKASRNAWYEKNKDKITKNRRSWREREPLRTAWLALKNRVQPQIGIKLTLTYENFVDLMSVTNCPICGIKMLEKGKARRGDSDSKSVDRIEAGGDYSPENCACICLRCNQVKNNGTFQEHLAIAQWMMEHT